MRAKANDLAHQRRERKDAIIPVLQIDYGHAGEEAEVVTFDFAVGNDMATGYIWATAIIRKGGGDVYTIASAVSWLAELGHNKVMLQAGGPQEIALMNAIKSKALKDGVCETILTRQTETHNSQAGGGAERAVQTVRKQMRAIKLATETRLREKIAQGMPFMTWVPRHAAWLYNRFHVRPDLGGLTPYEKVHMLKYQRPLVEMGEAVICRRPGSQLNKLELHWLEGVYLGRDARTDEHLVGTPGGVTRSRAIKRKVESKRWGGALMRAMTWTPWAATPTIRGRPPLKRSEQEPILLGPLPRHAGPAPAAPPPMPPPPGTPPPAAAGPGCGIPEAAAVAPAPAETTGESSPGGTAPTDGGVAQLPRQSPPAAAAGPGRGIPEAAAAGRAEKRGAAAAAAPRPPCRAPRGGGRPVRRPPTGRGTPWRRQPGAGWRIRRPARAGARRQPGWC